MYSCISILYFNLYLSLYICCLYLEKVVYLLMKKKLDKKNAELFLGEKTPKEIEKEKDH